MKIFKEKKEREIREDDSLFIKLWYNKRTHAMIVFGMYVIFFIILFILAAVNSDKNTDDNIVKAVELKPFFTNLNDEDLSYNVVINNSDEDIYYFSGSKEDNYVMGNLLHNADDLLIKISEDSCTVGFTVDGMFIEDADKLCPEVISYRMFDYKKIYDEISKNAKRIRKYDKYYLCILENNQYKIYFKDNTLSRIDILDEDVTYNINFYVRAQDLNEGIQNSNIE